MLAYDEMTLEEKRAFGIAALGRVQRDEDGFTVYATGIAPDAFRVWHDEHVGVRCTCARFHEAFRMGDDYQCEHILAVEYSLNPPDDAIITVAPVHAVDGARLRRVV